MSRVSTNNTIFANGDRVWYKRERDGKWKGPAKVIFQDGKIIWVRHGSSAVRVSVNRIVKQGEELYDNSNKSQEKEEEGTVDKDLGNKVVEIDDTDNNEQKVVEFEGYESIENNLEEMGEEEQHQNDYGDVADMDGRIEEVEQHDDDQENTNLSDMTIVTSDNKRKRKHQDDENSTNKRTKTSQFFPQSKGVKINLKKNDLIQVKLGDTSEEIYARVLNRSKVSGKYYNYFNVCGEDGLERNIDLERLMYRKVTEEEVNVVTVPREEQNSDECKGAKEIELKKLRL